MEHSICSVISPEAATRSCGAAGAQTQTRRPTCASRAQDPDQAGQIVDRIVDEPAGGAHSNQDVAIQAVGDAVEEELKAMAHERPAAARAARRALLRHRPPACSRPRSLA
ncbi:hypothetical protein ACRAWD_06585 [Caulobacter segnis]